MAGLIFRPIVTPRIKRRGRKSMVVLVLKLSEIRRSPNFDMNGSWTNNPMAVPETKLSPMVGIITKFRSRNLVITSISSTVAGLMQYRSLPVL